VVAVRVEGELAEELAGGRAADAVFEVVDEHQDAGRRLRIPSSRRRIFKLALSQLGAVASATEASIAG
jgi:hypothetical protein